MDTGQVGAGSPPGGLRSCGETGAKASVMPEGGTTDPGLARSIRYACRLLGAPLGVVHLIGPHGLRLAAMVGDDAGLVHQAARLWKVVAREGRTLVLPDARMDMRVGPPRTIGDGLRFFAGTPVLDADGAVVGTLCVLGPTPRPPPVVDDLTMLQDLGRSVSGRLEQLRNAADNAAMARRAELMERLLTVTAEAPDFIGALRAAAGALCEATAGTFCHVWRLHAASGEARLLAGTGFGAFHNPDFLAGLRQLRLTADNSPVCQALVTDRQSVVEDVRVMPPERFPAVGIAARHAVVALVATPFRVGEERCAFSVGFNEAPTDLAAKARLLNDATLALRPLLRRYIDESSVALFRRAVEASNDLVLITDTVVEAPDGPRILYMNHAGTRMTGFEVQDVVGRTPRIFQGPETAAGALATIREALLERRPVRQEVLNYRKDGSCFFSELDIAPVVDEAGLCTHFVSVQRDISDRKAAERIRLDAAQELETLIATMPAAVTRFRRQGGRWAISYASPSIAPLVGLEPVQLLRGSLPDRVGPDGLAALDAALDSAASDGQATLEFACGQGRNRPRIILGNLRAHVPGKAGEDMPGDAPEIIMSWTDVTGTRDMALQLAQSAKLAQLGELATGMAHELNQPLAGITLAAENALRSLATSPDAPPRVRQKLDLIIDLATRASAVIDHMRVFGRNSSGPARLVQLAGIVAGALRLLDSKLSSLDVRVVAELPDGLPPILGKPVPLEQVLINLIVNACDAYGSPNLTPEQRLIRIGAGVQDGWMHITVEDQAGGIAEDVLPRIFEPFFTTKPEGAGTGVGLSVSCGIMADMGGTIEAEVRDGGTVFTLLLPLAA
jgi:PAS domain S-box-containing protein